MPAKGHTTSGSPLTRYRTKRSVEHTPEPFGKGSAGSGLEGAGLFVVQKHAARRTHFDLRLELDGVLKSWAVPKGPSLDPDEKRLAVETEDHPFEYGDFEGVIPEGNYGAGAMIVWDRGTWIPLEDPGEGYQKGKLLFELRGYKLRGVWTMFRTKPPAIHRGKSKDEDRQWLLVKKPDTAASRDATLAEESVLSGMTVEELARGPERIRALERELDELGARPGPLDPKSVKLMLAQQSDEPFSEEGWLFELKYDGYRLVAAVREHQPYLRYRNGHDATELYPEIARALASHPVESLVLDGEVVVSDPSGKPSFQRLQKRAMLQRRPDIVRAALELPATLFAFDLLELNGKDARPLPLVERKRLLRSLLPPAGPIRFCDHVETQGRELYAQIGKMGLEGMVAKRADSAYVGRRSSDWRKYRVDRTGDFVIVGFTRPQGERTGFGALHLAVWRDQSGNGKDNAAGLVYAGRVGTGFDEALLESLGRRLRELVLETPPCSGPVPTGADSVWVRPELVCEVRYKEWTEQGLLRHPVFLRLREDKSPQECRSDQLEEKTAAGPEEGEAPPEPRIEQRARPPLQFSNLDKVFWPEDGYTKGDLIEFYRQVAPVMLRYLTSRPVVLTRYPDGIHGKSFFQKNAPDFAPDWIRTVRIWSEGSEREIDYFVCNDEETLLYLANLGAIVLHVWSSRLETLERPDWCILDLDPKEAPFEHVVEIAQDIHALCEEIGLPAYVKTSGSTGLHVLLPLGTTCTYEQSRTLGQLIAELIARQKTEIATVTRNPAKRDGKVYIDYVQNGHGRLLVAPFSVRPLIGAPVSTPLFWNEVVTGLRLDAYTISTVPKRLAGLDSDPLAGVLEDRPELIRVLEKLSARL